MNENVNKSGGSRFEDEGKSYGWWLAPLPGIKYVVNVAKQGAKKYAPLDWAEGQDFSVLYGCAMRHMLSAHPSQKGILSVNDDDGDQMHIAHAAWNLLCMLSLIAMGKAEECNDMDEWRGVTSDDIPEGEDFESWRPGQRTHSAHAGSSIGTITQMHPRDGFGYIEPHDGGKKVLFLPWSVSGDFAALRAGQVVRYDHIDEGVGPRAENVHSIADSDGAPSRTIDTVSPEAWRSQL